MARLRHAASLVRGTGFPPEAQGQGDGDLPFFKVGDFSSVGNETYLAQCDNWISEATASQLRARPVPADTVLLPKIGAAMLLGSRRITTQRSVFDNNVLGVVPSKINARYLRYWLITVDLRPTSQSWACSFVGRRRAAGSSSTYFRTRPTARDRRLPRRRDGEDRQARYGGAPTI